MDSLLLSLGHNSSAILIRDGKIVCGYETERISRTKSDSQFPALAITEINKQYGIAKNVDIYLSHWFPNGLADKETKYWSKDVLTSLFPDNTIHDLSLEFTHHDAHAYSAMAFAHDLPGNTAIVVADGFGNYGETLSVYTLNNDKPQLVHRCHGYDYSLGLMYQYATSFIGLKQNQDEYKLLGYESQISEAEEELITPAVDKNIEILVSKISKSFMLENPNDPMYSISALTHTMTNWYDVFESLAPISSPQIVARFVQRVIEGVLIEMVKHINFSNLILVGGCFYNVKLNGELAKYVPNKLCIMPLAGDQGAAIGRYKVDHPEFIMPDHLFWGHRCLKVTSKDPTILYSHSQEDTLQLVGGLLLSGHIVNLVRGSMEFGPRALCHTSTLAKPVVENVKYINHVNNRSDIMPMAPVMSRSDAEVMFKDVHKIHKSLDYMICTREYKEFDPYFDGVIRAIGHNLPLSNTYTGRVQIAREEVISSLVENLGPLINTSFNVHGKPIVYSMQHVYSDHAYQKERDHENRIYTVIEENKSEH